MICDNLTGQSLNGSRLNLTTEVQLTLTLHVFSQKLKTIHLYTNPLEYL